jgi:hypothetical protein
MPPDRQVCVSIAVRVVSIDPVEAAVHLCYNVVSQICVLLHHVDGRPVFFVRLIVVVVIFVVRVVVVVWVVRSTPCSGRIFFVRCVGEVNSACPLCVGRGVWRGLARVGAVYVLCRYSGGCIDRSQGCCCGRWAGLCNGLGCVIVN